MKFYNKMNRSIDDGVKQYCQNALEKGKNAWEQEFLDKAENIPIYFVQGCDDQLQKNYEELLKDYEGLEGLLEDVLNNRLKTPRPLQEVRSQENGSYLLNKIRQLQARMREDPASYLSDLHPMVRDFLKELYRDHEAELEEKIGEYRGGFDVLGLYLPNGFYNGNGSPEIWIYYDRIENAPICQHKLENIKYLTLGVLLHELGHAMMDPGYKATAPKNLCDWVEEALANKIELSCLNAIGNTDASDLNKKFVKKQIANYKLGYDLFSDGLKGKDLFPWAAWKDSKHFLHCKISELNQWQAAASGQSIDIHLLQKIYQNIIKAPIKYENIINELSKNVPLALSSITNLRNKSLHDCLKNHFSNKNNLFGRDSFLAEPFYEAMFPWKSSQNNVKDDARQNGWDDIVCKLHEDACKNHKGSKEPRLYEHQQKALVAVQNGKSIVVTTGTGSGKTECFLYPILNRLAKDCKNNERLTGVQALFLYPLNALIESQGDRLRSSLEIFNKNEPQKIRFANYTGKMKNERWEYAKDAKLSDAEIDGLSENQALWREDLHANPPQLLITNATMLEYALVRQKDEPLFQNSNLKFVVLDEAHTYTGSAAAELAMRLRRVLLAFNKTPDQVQFIATSATVGKANEIQKFLADVAGVSIQNVEIISGQRCASTLSPSLQNKAPADYESLIGQNASDEQKYQMLSDIPCFRKLRDAFIKQNRIAHFHVKGILGENNDEKVIQYLDWMSSVKNDSGNYFLPIKIHVFQKTVNLWACCNPNCCGKQPELAQGWEYGKVFFDLPEERIEVDPNTHEKKLISRCDACGESVFQVLECSQCGEIYLAAQGLDPDNQRNPLLRVPNDYTDEEEDRVKRYTNKNDAVPCLLKKTPANQWGVRTWRQFKVDPCSGFLKEDVGIADIRYATHDMKVRCTKCNIPLDIPEHLNPFGGFTLHKNLKGFAVGVKRLYNTLAKDVLRQDAPMNVPQATLNNPPPPQPIFNGKKLLCFTDNRQGTAGFAGSHSMKEEMDAVRTWIYKKMLDEKGKGNLFLSLEDLANGVAQELNHYRTVLDPNRNTREDGFYKKLLHLPDLKDAPERDLYRGTSLAKMFVWREFVQRTRGKKSLESLGLAKVCYGHKDCNNTFIDDLDNVDFNPQGGGIPISEQSSFAKVLLDFAFRTQAALATKGTDSCIVDAWEVNSIRECFGTSLQIKPLEEAFFGDVKKPNNAMKIAYYLLADPNDIQNAEQGDGYGKNLGGYKGPVEALLKNVKDVLIQKGTLWERTTTNDPMPQGCYIDLNRIYVTIPDKVWLCPATNTLLDQPLYGRDGRLYSPYITSISLPLHQSIEAASIPAKDLLSLNRPVPSVASNANEIWWSNAHEEIRKGYLNPKEVFCITQESTAQLNVLKRAEDQDKFKNGQINVYNCSTTMEMGVDIGDISIVAMTNVPPHEYNYTQRAGRAGRKGQGKSFIWTLTNAGAEEKNITKNPLAWVQKNTLRQALTIASDVILQRHVNAFLLTKFIKYLNQNGGGNQNGIDFETSLLSFFAEQSGFPGHFTNVLSEFLDKVWQKFYIISQNDIDQWIVQSKKNSKVAEFINWCNVNGTSLANDVKALIMGMTQQAPSSLIVNAQQQFADAQKNWLEKVRDIYLLIEGQTATNVIPNNKQFISTQRSQRHLLRNIAGKYGLSYLAEQGVLPSNGMPLDVIEVVPRNYGGSKKEDDNIPSRPRNIAIREYAPGTSIIVDGIRKFSSGVLMNWRPYNGDNGQPDPTCLYRFLTCPQCGAFAYTKSAINNTCLECGANIPGHARKVLEPSGFISTDEDRNVDTMASSKPPFELPHVSLFHEGVDAFKSVPSYNGLSNIDVKYGPAELVLLNGNGFAQNKNLADQNVPEQSADDHYHICLECGYASTSGENFVGGKKLSNHYKFNQMVKQKCGFQDQSHKVISLGASYRTYAFVLTINELNNEVAANTWALALRNAFVNRLNLNEDEIGWTVRKRENNICSIVLYDTAPGGAQLSTLAATSTNFTLTDLFFDARALLDGCPNKCESICLDCLLTRETQYMTNQLNRNVALRVLNDDFFNQLGIPASYCFWGNQTQFVARNNFLTDLKNKVTQQAEDIRFYLSDDYGDWEILEWNLNPEVRAAYTAGRISFIVSENLWNQVPTNTSLRAKISHLLRMAKIKVVKNLPITKNTTGVQSKPVFMEEKQQNGWMQYVAVPRAGQLGMTFDEQWGTPEYSYFRGLETTDCCLNCAEFTSLPSNGNNAEIKHLSKLTPPIYGNGAKPLDVDGFGNVLFSRLQLALPQAPVVLEELQLEDKYICNASGIRILAELVRYLNPCSKAKLSMMKNSKGEMRSATNRWHIDYPAHEQSQLVREALVQALPHLDPANIEVSIIDRNNNFHNRRFVLKYSDGSSYELGIGSSLTNWKIEESRNGAFSPAPRENNLNVHDEIQKLMMPASSRGAELKVSPACDDYFYLEKI